MQDPVNKDQLIKSCHVALKKDLEPLQTSINRGPHPKKRRRNSWRYKFPLRQALQVRKLSLQEWKLSQKFSSLFHLRLKSTKNETMLDQA